MPTPPADQVRANADIPKEEKLEQQAEPIVAAMIRLGDEVLTIIAAGNGKRGVTVQGRKPGPNAFYSDNGKVFIQLPAKLQRTALGEVVVKRVRAHYDRQPGYRASCERINVVVEF